MKYKVFILYKDGTTEQFNCNVITCHSGIGGIDFNTEFGAIPFGPSKSEKEVFRIEICPDSKYFHKG